MSDDMFDWERDMTEPLPFPCKKLHPLAQLPQKSEGDIGWDLFCVPDASFDYMDEDKEDTLGLPKDGLHKGLAPIFCKSDWANLLKYIEEWAYRGNDSRQSRIMVHNNCKAIVERMQAEGSAHVFSTGLAAAVPQGYAALLWDRSGMGAKRNIHRLAGVIDSTYRGEWKVSLINLSNSWQYITAGDKIVQAVIQKEYKVIPYWTDELDDTSRGAGGFGSTGR